jgi:Concanavalin A-like lectin/glucanases superfamily
LLRAVINKFEETIHLVEGSANPHSNLLNIIDFFSFCEKNSSTQIYSGFINDFIPYLIDIFRYHNLNFIDPEYILKANYVFNYSLSNLKSKDDILYKEIQTAQKNLKLQLIKSYFNLGEIENGLELIKEYSGLELSEQSKIPIEKRKKSKGRNEQEISTALSKIETPDSYYMFRVMNEINSEIDRIKSYSDGTINILFTTEDSKSHKQTGFVLQCSVDITEDINISTYSVLFENTIDYSDKDINSSINVIKSNFDSLLKFFDIKPPKNKTFKIKFENLSGVYKGGSFISGIVLILFIKYYNSLKKRSRFSLSTATAITGEMDAYGNFKRLPKNSIRTKVYSAYFSWIRSLIIPEENMPEANELLEELRNKYPRKVFELIPARTFSALNPTNNLLRQEKDSLRKYLYVYYKGAALSVIFSLILIATIISFKTIFKPPEKPLPKTSGDSYLIYTPDRTDKWVFQNQFQGNSDTINFGETAVGDMWYPTIELWNNSYKQEEIIFRLEGKDKDEFEIVWRDEPKQEKLPIINPDIIQRFYIKFRPLSINDTGFKEAKLVVNVNKDVKELFLKGKSGIYEGGYSLGFYKPDDYLIINNNSNLLGKEFTIDFWIKPLEIIKGLTESDRVGFIFDDNGANSKFNMGLNADSTLYLALYNRKTSESLAFINTNNKVYFKEWNHIQIILSNNQLAVYLNDKLTRFDKEAKVNSISDYIHLGYGDFPDRLDKRKKEAGYLRFNLADFKIFGVDKDNILDYKFEDANFETVYDLSNNDVWGKLRGGITRSLDYPKELKPVMNSVSKQNPDNALEISDRGLMLCTKNFFSKKSSFTISLDAYLYSSERNMQKHLFIFSHPDIDMLFYVDSTKANLSYNDKIRSFNKTKTIPFEYYDKWHRYTLQYSMEEKIITVYLDTIKFAVLDSLISDFDVSKWYYGIGFGNYTFFYSPRVLSSKILLDDIYFYNQKVSINKAFLKDKSNALAIWDFDNLSDNLVFDKLHSVPAFLWQVYRFIER